MASSGNFCTINPIGAQGNGTIETGTVTTGNLAVSIDETCFGTMGVTSGKWYWEWALTGSSQSGMAVGWANNMVTSSSELGYNSPSSETGAQIVYVYLSKNPPEIISDAPKSASNGTDTSMSEISQNDIIGVAADFDNDKWYFSINGSFTNARSGQDPATGANPLCSATGGGGLVTIARTSGFTWFPAFGNWAASTRDVKVNFGQDSTFSGSFSAGGNADESGFGDFKYSVPAGFKAMCSGNLPISDDIDPAQTDDDIPTKQFNAVVYTGNGSTQSISVGFKPDLVWYKRRDTTNPGVLMDSSRGVSEALEPNSNASADTNFTQGVTSFDTNGFSLGSQVQGNGSGGNLIAWCWRANGGTTASNSEGNITSTVQANTKAGFSIITYTGSGGTVSGANPTFGHGLESAPDFLIFKCRNTGSTNWIVWHSGLGGANKYISLNATSSAGTDTAWLSNTAPSSTLITTDNGGWGAVNGSSRTYVCYAWHSVEGSSSFGKFEGNSDADGPFVYTGFRPRLVFCKAIDASENWQVRDTARSTFNADSQVRIYWNSSSAEGSASTASPIDFLSNGFKVRGSNSEINTSTIVYGAWGDVPFKYNNTF